MIAAIICFGRTDRMLKKIIFLLKIQNQHVIECHLQNNKLDIIAVDRLNDLAILKSQEPNENFIYLSEINELIFKDGSLMDL